MMVYKLNLATPGNLTTNGTPNTETGAMFLKAGVRNAAMRAIYMLGKAAGLTAISSIGARVAKFATASTAGTAITPRADDPGMQAAKATAASRQTLGATRTDIMVIGCGAGGPGQWVAQDDGAELLMEGGGAFSLDIIDIAGTASLAYELSAEFRE